MIHLTHWEWELHRKRKRIERLTRQIQRHDEFMKRARKRGMFQR